jgi:hypothetical protein
MRASKTFLPLKVQLSEIITRLIVSMAIEYGHQNLELQITDRFQFQKLLKAVTTLVQG